MPKVLRTSVRPFQKVLHDCRDKQGQRVQRYAPSNTLCRFCNTQIVYVWSNDPVVKAKLKAKPKPKIQTKPKPKIKLRKRRRTNHGRRNRYANNL
jgi:hypothetical protein